MNNNNLNNEYFKLTIRLLKEHKLYNKLILKESLSKIPLESVYDIMALPKKITSYIGLLKINELDYYTNFKNDYNEKIKENMRNKYKEVFYLSLNHYKTIIIKYSICDLKKLKKNVDEIIDSHFNTNNSSELICLSTVFHPITDAMNKNHLTMDFIQNFLHYFNLELMNKKIKTNVTDK